MLDLCAAPGGKTTQLRGDVTAVEIDPNRASELRENLAPARRHERAPSSRRTARRCRPSSTASTGRSSTRRAPASASSAQRPDLRWRATPLPELQLALLRAAAERVKPGGTIVYSVCTINADENEAVVDASGLEVVPLGDEWPQFAHPRRPEFLLTLPHVHGTSGFFIGRLRVYVDRAAWGGRAGSGPSKSSRRSTRRTSRTSASRSTSLLRTGARVFHFDVGDGHFVEPITIGPIVLESIAPLIHAVGGARSTAI